MLTINVVEHLEKLRKCGENPKMIIPETYIIKGDTHESDLEDCMHRISPHPENSMWIIKPGEFSNRGKGIQIAMQKSEITGIVNTMYNPDKKNCILVQRYLENPLLYQKRKFDLRCYCMIIKAPQKFSVFAYKYGYARTTSYEYVFEKYPDD